jgi:ABC-2 type transport system ATP-binding protein
MSPDLERPPAPPSAPETADVGRIVARGLSRRFGEKLAVAPFDLDVGPGGVAGLLGPNGSGKSTFLRILIGLVKPDTGTARVDGVDLSGDGTEIRKLISYSPGEVRLYGEMRGGEHLAWFLRSRGAQAFEKSRELADQLGLPMKQRVDSYSHGMKRQLMFAAAMGPEVRLRILDEPTEGLDPEKRAVVSDILRADAERGTTILLSSHHLAEVDRLCDRLIFMSSGELLSVESCADVLARARRFLHASYPEGTDEARLRTTLQALPGAKVRVEGVYVTAELESDDPRIFVAALCTAAGLPSPAKIEYGQLSLAELYRDLYGVEGL